MLRHFAMLRVCDGPALCPNAAAVKLEGPLVAAWIMLPLLLLLLLQQLPLPRLPAQLLLLHVLHV
jgi:hypothetical protein